MTTAAAGRLPDFIIAGAMRSGTTSIFRYLDSHPEIGMVPKELGFFTDRFAEGVDWYRAQFAALGPVRVVGEATADYLARDSAINRIAEVVPRVRLIATLRDPVERAWSHYGLLKERGREHRSFGAALDDEMERLAADGPNAAGVFYLYHSLYDVHIERALRLFPEEQLHVSIFERMVAEPAAAYRSMCRFLEVAAAFTPPMLGVAVNPFVRFHSLRLRRLTHRLPGPLGALVARINTYRVGRPPELDAKERARLEEFFAPRVERLESLIGFPVNEWRRS